MKPAMPAASMTPSIQTIGSWLVNWSDAGMPRS